MRFSHFFIDRPIFAAVLSIIITIAGLLVERALPISEYPEIAPPTVSIRATYPGASAQVLAETVATPIEQEVNGVDDMLYITSQSVGDGTLTIDVVFKPGVNVDTAQVLVQNRVSVATPRLPEDVQRLGVTVRKASPDLMMVVHMISPDGSRDQQYISNYATLYIKDALARVDGVGDVNVFGARDYSMRIWLDPGQGGGARSDRGRCRGRVARSEPAGRSGRDQSAAGDVTGRVSVVGADARAARGRRAVRQHRRARRPERRLRAHPRHRPCRARVAGLHGQRLPEQGRGDSDRDLSASGFERADHGRRGEAGDGGGEEGLPVGARLYRRLQSHRVHPAVDQRGAADAVRGDRAGGLRGDPVPADLACRDHSRWSRSRCRWSAASWSWDWSASRSTRCRCSAWCWRSASWWTMRSWWWRTSSAIIQQGMSPTRCGAYDHGRGRQRADRDRAGAVRGVHPDRVHQRPAGFVLSAVRHHYRRGHGHFRVRLADAVAGTGGAVAEAAHARTETYRVPIAWARRCVHSSPGSTGCSIDCRPATAGWWRGWCASVSSCWWPMPG